MATLRQLRTRVGSIRNIQRVTNAMYMVAAAKMRRAQEAIESARPYAEQLDSILHHLQGSVDKEDNPLFVERPVERSAMVVITADRGLCGGFNGNLSRRAQSELRAAESEVDLIAVGRKGSSFLRSRGFEVHHEFEGIFFHLQFSQAVEIAQRLTADFLEGRVDRVQLVFSEFRSVAEQTPVVKQLLPIVPTEGETGVDVDYLFEPPPAELLEILVPRHVNFQVWRALLESNAGFFAAQMTSMDNATKNAGDLIDELTREMNKERQSAITLELMDIIGGAEAVAG